MTINYSSLVHGYLDAHNAHDPDRSLAFLADDVRLEAVGRGEVSGLEEARRVAAWDAVLQSQMKAFDLRASGRDVYARMEERNEWLRLAGISHLEYPDCRFTFRGRLICHVRMEMAEESRRLFGETLQTIVAWAAHERPVDLGRLLPAGEFQYGPRAARGWLNLLAHWRAATGGRRPAADR